MPANGSEYVTVAAEVTVNDRRLNARYQVHPEVWATEEGREFARGQVRQMLGEEIVRALDPEVTVLEEDGA